MKTLLLASALLLALSACSNSTAPTPAAKSPAAPVATASEQVPAPPMSAPATAGGIPALPSTRVSATVEGVAHVVFASVGTCTADGYSTPQCDRARSTALAMLALDPPRYADIESCQAQFKWCSQWPSGQFAKQFSPPPSGFSLGGEAKGSAGPSPEHPSVYAPVFIDNEGTPVLAINQPTGVQVIRLAPAKPADSKSVDSKSVDSKPSQAAKTP